MRTTAVAHLHCYLDDDTGCPVVLSGLKPPANDQSLEPEGRRPAAYSEVSIQSGMGGKAGGAVDGHV